MASSDSTPLQIGLAGFGNVGAGVYKNLLKNREILQRRTGRDLEIRRIVVRDPSKDREVPLPEELVTTDLETLVDDDEIDIVILGRLEDGSCHRSIILHELAHSYHDQILSFDRPDIIQAYEKAKSAGTYEEVLLYTGRRVRHYAMTDHKEYFAEATEAYFYRNDFYPFVAAELKKHDPALYELMARTWGPLK